MLYERKETKDQIKIKYKYWASYYIILLLFVVLAVVANDYLSWFLPLFILLAILFTVDFWKPNQEVRKAMKQGRVEVTGSKFSFSKPLTAVIKKKK